MSWGKGRDAYAAYMPICLSNVIGALRLVKCIWVFRRARYVPSAVWQYKHDSEKSMCALRSIQPCKSAKWRNIYIDYWQTRHFLGWWLYLAYRQTFSSVQLQFNAYVKVYHSKVKLRLFALCFKQTFSFFHHHCHCHNKD